MGAGTPIRPVQQSVETPSADLSPNPFRAGSLQNTAGEAISGVGNSLMGIWQAQNQHRNAIDMADASNQFETQIGSLKTDILNSGQSAPDMVQNFNTSSKELINAYTDPQSSPYPHIAPQLAVSLRNQVGQHLQSFPAEATQRVYHDLDFKFNQQTSAAAATIGQNYTIAGTADNPTFQLNADGLAAMQRQAKAIDQAYPPDARPTENQYYRNVLAQKAAMQTGMSVAQDHPSLVDSYIKQHAAVLTPEQQMQLTNRATAAIDLPMRQINASNAATRAQLLQKFDGQVQNGNLDTAALDHAARFKLITPDDYERYSGIPLAMPSDPGAVAAAKDAIDGATDKDSLDGLRAAIAGNPNIRGKDSVALPILIENKKRRLATPAGQSDISARAAIDAAYVPKNFVDEHLNNSSYRAAHVQAVKAYEAATFGRPSDPKVYDAAARAAIAAHPPKIQFPVADTPAPAKPPPGASPRLPGESWAAYGKRMKAATGATP
ncbi:MAG: hypothetical protein WAU89_23340 [Candidatus Acidiferrales bacterium]